MRENTIWYTAGTSRLVANSTTEPIVQFSNNFQREKYLLSKLTTV